MLIDFLSQMRYLGKNDKKCCIQSVLHRLLYIFPIFLGICEYHASKNLPPAKLQRVIFSHLRTNRSAAQQVRDPLTQMNDNRKELSLVSYFPTEWFWRVANRFCRKCHEEIVMKKNVFMVLLSEFWPFFKQGTDQICQLLLITFPQVLTARNKTRHFGLTKRRESSFCQSDSVLRSMWKVCAGLPMTFCVWNSQNKSTVHPL